MTVLGDRQLIWSAREQVRHLLRRLGPGLITGASDDDPSGIGTYSQAGAQLGYGIGWTMLLTYPLMVGIQEISARIGRTTGHGIAGNLCRYYPNWLLQLIVALLFVANTINIGADLSAMADAAFPAAIRNRICHVLLDHYRFYELQPLRDSAQVAYPEPFYLCCGGVCLPCELAFRFCGGAAATCELE
jgi:hypothetical protein